jgi:hypothetical protein
MINIHFETSLRIIDKTTNWDLLLDSGSSHSHAASHCQTQDTGKKFNQFRQFPQKVKSIYFKDRAI